jgi:hypothetical protein
VAVKEGIAIAPGKTKPIDFKMPFCNSLYHISLRIIRLQPTSEPRFNVPPTDPASRAQLSLMLEHQPYAGARPCRGGSLLGEPVIWGGRTGFRVATVAFGYIPAGPHWVTLVAATPVTISKNAAQAIAKISRVRSDRELEVTADNVLADRHHRRPQPAVMHVIGVSPSGGCLWKERIPDSSEPVTFGAWGSLPDPAPFLRATELKDPLERALAMLGVRENVIFALSSAGAVEYSDHLGTPPKECEMLHGSAHYGFFKFTLTDGVKRLSARNEECADLRRGLPAREVCTGQITGAQYTIDISMELCPLGRHRRDTFAARINAIHLAADADRRIVAGEILTTVLGPGASPELADAFIDLKHAQSYVNQHFAITPDPIWGDRVHVTVLQRTREGAVMIDPAADDDEHRSQDTVVDECGIRRKAPTRNGDSIHFSLYPIEPDFEQPLALSLLFRRYGLPLFEGALGKAQIAFSGALDSKETAFEYLIQRYRFYRSERHDKPTLFWSALTLGPSAPVNELTGGHGLSSAALGRDLELLLQYHSRKWKVDAFDLRPLLDTPLGSRLFNLDTAKAEIVYAYDSATNAENKDGKWKITKMRDPRRDTRLTHHSFGNTDDVAVIDLATLPADRIANCSVESELKFRCSDQPLRHSKLFPRSPGIAEGAYIGRVLCFGAEAYIFERKLFVNVPLGEERTVYLAVNRAHTDGALPETAADARPVVFGLIVRRMPGITLPIPHLSHRFDAGGGRRFGTVVRLPP